MKIAILAIGWFLMLPAIQNRSLSAQAIPLNSQTNASHGKMLFLQPGVDVLRPHDQLFRIKQELIVKTRLNLDSINQWSDDLIASLHAEPNHHFLAAVYSLLGQANVFKTDFAKARQCYATALDMAIQRNDDAQVSEIYMHFGWSYIYGNHYDTAIDYTTKALVMAEFIRDTQLIIAIYRNLPRLHYLADDYLSAYKTSKALMEISKAANDPAGLKYGESLVSDLCGEMNLREKQMDFVHAALSKLRFTNDLNSLYVILNTAYEGYLNNDMPDSSLFYARKVFPVAKQLGFNNGIDKLAKAHLACGHLDSARYYYEASLADNLKFGNYIDIYKYLDLGVIEFAQGNYSKAFKYYQLAESNIEKPKINTRRDIYWALYEYYDKHENYEQANGYLEKYNALTDTIYSFQTGVALLDHEAKMYKGQVEILSRDNELNASAIHRQRQQSKLAYTTAIIILMVGGFAFYRFKKQRELRSKEALAAERLRISRDLHDEVGSTLSGIAMYTHVAQQQNKNSESSAVELSLQLMQASAHEMVNKLSDIVWLINPDQDTIAELFSRLERYAIQMARASSMQVEVLLPEKFAESHIPLEARRNIYLFCKEAINNAAKYSKGSVIQLQVRQDKEGMRFSVSDDGKGFDEITIRKGNGLRNMRKRAEEIGAIVDFAFGKGKGTTVEMYYKHVA